VKNIKIDLIKKDKLNDITGGMIRVGTGIKPDKIRYF